MNKGTLVLGCLITCLAILGGQNAFAADEKADKTDKADKAVYTVIVKSVQVKETNKEGNAWDVNNGRPDLAVIVRNVDKPDMKNFETKTHNDVFTAKFDAPTTIKVSPGQTLEFEVVDKDLALNDTIGKIQKKMTAEMLKEGKFKVEKFHQVITLELEFKKIGS